MDERTKDLRAAAVARAVAYLRNVPMLATYPLTKHRDVYDLFVQEPEVQRFVQAQPRKDPDELATDLLDAADLFLYGGKQLEKINRWYADLPKADLTDREAKFLCALWKLAQLYGMNPMVTYRQLAQAMAAEFNEKEVSPGTIGVYVARLVKKGCFRITPGKPRGPHQRGKRESTIFHLD